MDSSYGPCSTKLFNSLAPDGEVLEKTKITLLGESPNALARLYQYVPSSNESIMPGRFRCIDTVGAATVTEPDDSGVFTVSGVSQQLVEEVGLPEADAIVTWEITIKGCETC